MKMIHLSSILIILGLFLKPVMLLANENSEQSIKFHPNYKKIAIPETITSQGSATVDAPIGDHNQSPILKVYINDQGPFFFMFDTGWSNSLISQRVARKLKLPLADTVSHWVQTPSQVVEVFQNLYFVEKLTVGGVTLHHYALNASSGFEDDVSQFKRRGLVNESGLDGILGVNSFYGLKFKIDYKNEKITFNKSSLSKDEPKVLPYGQPDTVPNLNLTIHFNKLKKDHEQNFIVDTGNYTYFLINSCKIPEMHKFTGKEQLMSYDFQGNDRKEFFAKLYGDIQIFKDYKIKSPYITFSSVNCKTRPRGLIGRKFFEDHLVTIDHDDQLIKIEPYKK